MYIFKELQELMLLEFPKYKKYLRSHLKRDLLRFRNREEFFIFNIHDIYKHGSLKVSILEFKNSAYIPELFTIGNWEYS